MAFYKPGAGLDVKYLCSWDYRVGRICDMAFLRRPRAWRISCSWSQRILPRASPQNKSQIFNLGGPPCQGNPGCNKDQILPAEPEESHIDENQLCLWQWDESCRPRCSSSRSTCGSRSLKPSSSTWEKNKSPSQVLAASYEINCFSFMFCRT